MEKLLQQICISHNISPHRNQGILIVPVQTQTDGLRFVKDMLYELVDVKTALFLSGGKTPKSLVTKIAEEKKLRVGVVGQVDERYGEAMHEHSNEKMFNETGFLDYLKGEGIMFHSMLHTMGRRKERTREELAEVYDQLLRSLFTVYSRSVATLGIGSDGHIAGIAPSAKQNNFINPLFGKERQHQMVSEFDDKEGPFKERITMTFLGLSMMDVLIPIVFGEDKKVALEKMFEEGKEEDIPARFLLRPEIADKTIIITDQPI